MKNIRKNNKPETVRPSFFEQLVFSEVKKISKGQTFTYKQIAQKIGRPNSQRAVGNALGKNFDPTIPCHRVVRSDGGIGGYNRGVEVKIKKLKQEGVL